MTEQSRVAGGEVPRFRLGGIRVSAIGYAEGCDLISSFAQEGRSGYICVTNARTVELANRDRDFCRIQNDSLLTVADGTPLVWMARRMGFPGAGRIPGPELMVEMLNHSAGYGFSHFFYGGSEKTVEKIKSRLKKDYSAVAVKGVVSPPFQPIDAFDIDGLARELNELKPTFFWCGLGAPKQEFLISRLAPKLNHTICLGVGLAFDYFAGTVHAPPAIVRKTKMEWLYRCIQQPLKARRFIIPFFKTLGMLIKVYATGRA